MNKIFTVSGKRKRAIAKATIRPGNGVVKINNVLIDLIQPGISRAKMQEPLIIAGSLSNSIDIDIKVEGGGMNSQADAIRLAIAKSILAFSKDGKLKKEFMNYDRQLLVADVRRKEPSKPNRHSQARAKRQKSYR
ncbi:MAG: 30S ribosomal protein S9 [Candidatus Woesearchaeota archaeon]